MMPRERRHLNPGERIKQLEAEKAALVGLIRLARRLHVPFTFTCCRCGRPAAEGCRLCKDCEEKS